MKLTNFLNKCEMSFITYNQDQREYMFKSCLRL